MAPEKSESEKSVVYTVPYVRETSKETSTKTSDLKIKMCGCVIITALLVGGMVTAAYLLSPSKLKGDENPVSPNVKTYEATFQVDGKDKREDVRIDHGSEIAIFDDLTDEFTVVLDYRRSLAVFKNLKNNTCYFTNLEDIPMIENVMQQEDDELEALFFLADDEEVQKHATLTIDSTLVLPSDYVTKTNHVVVSNMCTRSTSFWGRIIEKQPARKDSIRQKRQLEFHPHPDDFSFCPCRPWNCCSLRRCCIYFYVPTLNFQRNINNFQRNMFGPLF
ncbi:hypothetical protein HOLleu_14180 [Holothuria leucospilota]|uniref:BRICHOS domain-containing protein n=1 Tax=Holothuria leucospilota TaxID=206669 RepID=A0A9Q1C8C3_HOLLE|nr:hypothetical protein HOLleu_14180 [Holothuria leucospilota]